MAQPADTSDEEEDLASFGAREGLALGAVLIVIVVAVAVAGDAVERNLEHIEAAVAALGPWSVAAFLGFAVFGASVFVPETMVGVLGGALFGTQRGLAFACVGFLLASILQYVLGHWLLQRRVQQMVSQRPTLAAIQQEALEERYTFQVLLRLTPLNPALVSYAMGAAGVPFLAYFVGCFAYFPYLLLEVYFGTFAHDLAVGGNAASHGWVGWLTLVIGGSAVVAVSHRAYRTVLRALED